MHTSKNKAYCSMGMGVILKIFVTFACGYFLKRFQLFGHVDIGGAGIGNLEFYHDGHLAAASTITVQTSSLKSVVAKNKIPTKSIIQ